MIERDPVFVAQHASVLHGGEVAVEPVEAAEVPVVAQPKQHGRRAAWILSMVIMGGLVGIVVVGLMKFMNGPVQASAIAPTPSPAHIVSNQPTTNQLSGLDFEMTYPGKFDQVKQLKNDAQAVEQYYVSSKADYRRTIAVAVRLLPSDLIDDDSNYKFRKIHPEVYTERRDTLGGEAVYVMSKNDNTEISLFWAHKGRILSVSMTSSNPEDILADFMKTVEPTLRWRA